MRKQLTDAVCVIMWNYLDDLNYWCAAYTVDDVNAVTGGREFNSMDDVKAYRDKVRTILEGLIND